MEFELTLLIPAYKEEKRIGPTLEELAKYLDANNLSESTEVLIYDSASPDQTEQVARSKSGLFKHFRLEKAADHPGPVKGRDVREGMLLAKGKKILMMDADLATPLHHIAETLEKAKSHDIVIGVRDVTKLHKGALRKLLSWGGNIAVQTLILPGIKDTQCGFKLFSREAAQSVFPKLTLMSWTFDLEVLAIARKVHGFKIGTVDIPDWEDKAGGTLAPSAGLAIASLLDLLKVRINLWLGKYGRKGKV